MKSQDMALVATYITVLAIAISGIACEKVITEILEPGDCSQRAQENDFITVHFESKYEDGEKISST